MAEVRITQLPTASASDYVDDTVFPVVTTDATTGETSTKQASMQGFIENYACNIQCATLSLTDTEVRNLFSTPKPIIAAQGAGTVIDVIAAFISIDYQTQDYATNVGIEIKTFGATDNQFASANALNADTSVIRKMTVHDGSFSASDTQLIANSGLYVQALVGNPTDGDSPIDVFVFYRVITL